MKAVLHFLRALRILQTRKEKSVKQWNGETVQLWAAVEKWTSYFLEGSAVLLWRNFLGLLCSEKASWKNLHGFYKGWQLLLRIPEHGNYIWCLVHHFAVLMSNVNGLSLLWFIGDRICKCPSLRAHYGSLWKFCQKPVLLFLHVPRVLSNVVTWVRNF